MLALNSDELRWVQRNNILHPRSEARAQPPFSNIAKRILQPVLTMVLTTEGAGPEYSAAAEKLTEMASSLVADPAMMNRATLKQVEMATYVPKSMTQCALSAPWLPG